MAPLFSICLPAYEDASAVRRAIAGLQRQENTDWECLIRDDSTSTRIGDVIAGLADPRIRYRRNAPALGVPRNWNAVLSEARGTYVSLLHQDDFYATPNVLDAVRQALADGQAGCAVCARSVWRHGVRVGAYRRNERAIAHFLREFPQRSLVVNRIGHPSVVFVRARLATVLFDERLRYFLDTDWYARLWQAAKGAVVYLPDAVVGLEMDRTGQLSGQCTRQLAATARELDAVLEKWQATPRQAALAQARFFASHLRHLRPEGRQALIQRLRRFSFRQKIVFGGAFFCLLWHMLYRALRRGLGLTPWG